MATHAVTLELPEPLYRRAAQRAAAGQHAVEEELTMVLNEAFTEPESGLPAALEEELAQLKFLDDVSLWRAAELRMPDESVERWRELVEKRDLMGSSATESQEIEQLLGLADRVMLIRAEAAVLLKDRGHDISRLIAPTVRG
jgi:hypothetical protein